MAATSPRPLDQRVQWNATGHPVPPRGVVQHGRRTLDVGDASHLRHHRARHARANAAHHQIDDVLDAGMLYRLSRTPTRPDPVAGRP